MPSKSRTYEMVSRNLKSFGVSQKNEPLLYKINKLIKEPGADKNKITSLAIQYLSENKRYIAHRVIREKLQAVFAILGENDKKTAEGFAKSLNSTHDVIVGNAHFRRNEQLPPGEGFEIDKIMTRYQVGQGANSDHVKPIADVDDDERLKNIEKLLVGMKEKYNPIYHFNSKEYKAMMKAMTAVDEYRKAGTDAVDKNVLDDLLKNVADKAAAYIQAKESLPTTPLGKQRLKMALQAVYSVDPDRAQKLIDENTDRRIERLNNIEKMLGGMSESDKQFTKKENFQGGIKLTEIEEDVYKVYSPKKAIDRLEKKLEEVEKKFNDPNTAMDVVYARYISLLGVRRYIKETNEVIPMDENTLDKKLLEVHKSRAFTNVLDRALTSKSAAEGQTEKMSLKTFAEEVSKETLNIQNENQTKELDQNLNINAEIEAANNATKKAMEMLTF